MSTQQETNTHNSLHELFRRDGGMEPLHQRKTYTSQEIMDLLNNHPELRINDDPYLLQLAQMLIVNPDDGNLQQLFAMIIEQKYNETISDNDAFRANYPMSGTASYPSDFIEVGQMPHHYGPVGLNISQMPSHIIVTGPAGSGKTTLLTRIITNPMLLKKARVIVITRKRDFRHLISDPLIADRTVIFQLEDLALCLTQSPRKNKKMAWANELSRMLGQSYNLVSAHRLMNETLIEMLTHHPEGVYPTLTQWIEALKNYKSKDFHRDAPLKTSAINCLTDLHNCTDAIWNYSSSSFMKHLTATPGLAIIEVATLPPTHVTFLATYMARWLYFTRINP